MANVFERLKPRFKFLNLISQGGDIFYVLRKGPQVHKWNNLCSIELGCRI